MYEFMLERNWEPWQWMSLSQVGEQTLEWRQLLFPMYKIENSPNVKFSLFNTTVYTNIPHSFLHFLLSLFEVHLVQANTFYLGKMKVTTFIS